MTNYTLDRENAARKRSQEVSALNDLRDVAGNETPARASHYVYLWKELRADAADTQADNERIAHAAQHAHELAGNASTELQASGASIKESLAAIGELADGAEKTQV